MIAGLDGCRGGWIAAIQQGDGTRLEVLPSPETLFRDPALIAAVIDMPIGLPERGPRECDLLARRFLGRGRSSSVFPAPIRSMLNARDRIEASEIRYAAEGKRCSVQLAAILPKIRQIDKLINAHVQFKVREGHPEVTFAVMNDDHPMSLPKRRPAGRSERLALLARYFPDVATIWQTRDPLPRMQSTRTRCSGPRFESLTVQAGLFPRTRQSTSPAGEWRWSREPHIYKDAREQDTSDNSKLT